MLCDTIIKLFFVYLKNLWCFTLRLIYWNVNGIRACINKGFLDFFQKINADIFCIGETKSQENQIDLNLGDKYFQYWNYAEKKGYSGTAVFSSIKPVSVVYDFEFMEQPSEGRVITLEFLNFYLVNCYTPNSRADLSRLSYRCKWEDDFREYLTELRKIKPIILCGDLNVAHREIDLKNPSSNHNSAGFTDKEREKFTRLLNSGFTDSFRYMYPDKTGAYTWWSYIGKARMRNAGWRIDYFLVSDELKENIVNTKIYSEILGSDHCPVGLEISF